jgi:hypothetical protein
VSEETTEGTKAPTSSNDALYSRFAAEREEWSTKIGGYAARLRDIYQVGDLLTDLYSQRQIAVEYTHTLMAHLTKINIVYREKRQERFEYYSRSYDLRLDKDMKYEYIAKDLSVIVERREYLQNHLEYFRETVKTIDTMCFGIKHRISLEEYRRG